MEDTKIDAAQRAADRETCKSINVERVQRIAEWYIDALDAAEQRIAEFALALDHANLRIVELEREWTECPECAFRYWREHTKADGTLSCPLCELTAAAAANARRVAELDSQYVAVAARLDWIIDAATGNVSDFAESFPEVRYVLDLRQERDAALARATQAERAIKSVATMLGWGNVPPQETLERDINALKARADKAEADAAALRERARNLAVLHAKVVAAVNRGVVMPGYVMEILALLTEGEGRES